MLNTTTLTKTVLMTLTLIVLPNLAKAASIQIDSPVKVYERNILGDSVKKELNVLVTDTGLVVLHRKENDGGISFFLKPSAVKELEALFAKGAEWAATAKENQVEIVKEIGTVRYNERNTLTAHFLSAQKGKMHCIVLMIEMAGDDATFFLWPGKSEQIMERIAKAPEYKGKLEARMKAKAEKSKLFN